MTTTEQLRRAMMDSLEGFAADVAGVLELEQGPSSLLPGQSNIKNVLARSETLRLLAVGDTVLVAPYTPGAYAREQASLKSSAVRMGIHVELKKVTILIEGEMPQNFIRVTRTK